MTKLIELINAPQGKIILMEIFKDGKKMAEQDISDLTPREMKREIEYQEDIGRTWSYKTVIFNDGR